MKKLIFWGTIFALFVLGGGGAGAYISHTNAVLCNIINLLVRILRTIQIPSLVLRKTAIVIIRKIIAQAIQAQVVLLTLAVILQAARIKIRIRIVLHHLLVAVKTSKAVNQAVRKATKVAAANLLLNHQPNLQLLGQAAKKSK